MRDSLLRGEAPIASHLLYTQPGILNDQDAAERQWGIDAGLAWGQVADATVVYVDRGVSSGMTWGTVRAKHEGRPVEYRTLDRLALRCPPSELGIDGPPVAKRKGPSLSRGLPSFAV